jgi:16S rRNA (cytidine1402-2'-O)-methyltransferase
MLKRIMAGILFMIGTPIGNLEDLTLRAGRILREVDAIACEDTRVTSKLLAHFGYPKKNLFALHHHSSTRDIERIINLLEQGKQVAFVSDAGTPGVNDPGGKLVEAAYRAGCQISPVPGTSALTAAISVCGFPMERFTYVGFIPHKKGRERCFQEIAGRDDASIFLESTHRILKTLLALQAALHSERLIFVGRELTKMHETLYRGTIDEVVAMMHAGSIKGEFIIVIAPKNFTS